LQIRDADCPPIAGHELLDAFSQVAEFDAAMLLVAD
jgi:hypothetical protein